MIQDCCAIEVELHGAMYTAKDVSFAAVKQLFVLVCTN